MEAVAVLPSREASDLASRDVLAEPALAADVLYGVPAVAVPSTPFVVVVIGLALVGCATSAAALLGRRGANARRSASLSTVARLTNPGCDLPTSRDVDADAADRTSEPQAAGSQRGDVTVLVAVLGEPTAVADVNPVLRSLGSRLGQVILARPVGLESIDDGWDLAEEATARTLSQAALFVPGRPPAIVPIPGHGERAITRIAAAQAAGVVVLAGDPGARPERCRSLELWDCTILVVPGTSGNGTDSP